MDEREYRLARLNALATLMDVAGMSVAEATRIRELLSEEQLQTLRVAGACAISSLKRSQVLGVLAGIESSCRPAASALPLTS